MAVETQRMQQFRGLGLHGTVESSFEAQFQDGEIKGLSEIARPRWELLTLHAFTRNAGRPP